MEGKAAMLVGTSGLVGGELLNYLLKALESPDAELCKASLTRS